VKIPKPSDADKAYFRSLVPDDPRVVAKPMFGNIAAFVNGNMFMGLFGSRVGLRLGESDRRRLRAVPGTDDFGPVGRPMKEYVSIPESWREAPASAEEWVDLAIDHVASMPPKKK